MVKLFIALIGLCIGLGTADFVRFANRVADLAPNPDLDHATIVVLTGGSGIRIRRAVELLEQDQSRRLFVSGVNETLTAETLARELDIDAALFDCCIDIGYSAGSTEGNADEVAEWLQSRGIHEITLVTSNYHMPRAMIELRHKNPTTILNPYPVQTQIDPGNWFSSPRAFRGLLQEWAKYRITRIRRGGVE